MFNDLYVVGNGDSYLTVLNQDQGKDGVWRQVALVSAEVNYAAVQSQKAVSTCKQILPFRFARQNNNLNFATNNTHQK